MEHRSRLPWILVVLMAIGAGALCGAEDTPTEGTGCPMHQQHQQAAGSKQEMDARGSEGMGFSQTKTTHHFLLHKDGGAIQVTVNSATDKSVIEQIQMHLRHIAQTFQSGDFSIPMFVHDQAVPGVAEMAKLKDKIVYRYQSLGGGGSVAIRSTDREAIDAVHRFLRFQIREHETGDTLDVRD